MLFWNHKDIGDAFSLLIDLNKSLHSMKQIDELSLIEISGALKLFLTKLSPMIGETSLNDRKRIKQDRLERKRLKKDVFEQRSQNRKNWQKKPYGMAEISEGKNIMCSINGTKFYVSIKEIEKLIMSLDMLKAEITSNRNCHFKVMGIQEDVETNFKDDENISQIFDDPENDKGEYADPGHVRSRITVLKTKGIVVSGEGQSFSTEHTQHLNVEPLSRWAFTQLTGHFQDTDDDEPKPESCGKVESIHHRSWVSLWELCTTIIVMFHAAFGDFSRLKICKTCGVLFYENRSDRKEFCGMLCRVKYNQAQESPETRKCRMRQNAWIRNYAAKTRSSKTINTVYKDRCSKCTNSTMKGGDCAESLKIVEALSSKKK